MKPSETQSFMTTREACTRFRYSRPDSFLRAWRARGLPLYRRPGGHWLIAVEDLGGFVEQQEAG